MAKVKSRETLPPLNHPGVMLWEDYIQGNHLTQIRVAKDAGIRPTTLGAICRGKRSISPAVDLRLCTFFGLSNGFFLRLQALYQTEQARVEFGEQIRHEVHPLVTSA